MSTNAYFPNNTSITDEHALYIQISTQQSTPSSLFAHFYFISWPSDLPGVPGLWIAPNSSPTPLCPLFLPPIWNLEGVDEAGVSELELSPNLVKNPFFFCGCFGSSFNPTSSKPSSAVGCGFSKCLSLMADLGSRGIRAESRLCLPPSPCTMGERAEMSNDLLYESKDSRDIENGSMSSLWRVLVDVRETFDRRGQIPFFSGGDGGRYTPLSLTTLILYSGGS